MAEIIVLNGTSSSGKTSIAREFQEIAPSLFLNLSIDSILYALPPSLLEALKRGAVGAAEVRYPELVEAFYACVSSVAGRGVNLIVDHAVVSQKEAELLLAAIGGHRSLLVGIECPVDILAAREQARGDRRIGMAAAQAQRIHNWLRYDLTIDSSRYSPADAARAILEVCRDRWWRARGD